MKKLFNHLMLPMKVALIALFVMSVATADARDVEQAKQAAMQQMKKYAAKKANRKGGTVVAVDPQLVFSKAKRSSDAYYYVFSAGKDLGFTVVSGDDRLPAIVGYTESGEFDAENMPEGLAAYMEQYQNFVDNATDAQINEVKAFKAMAKHEAMAPLMQEKWDQGEPYNNLCPNLSYYSPAGSTNVVTKKTVTGCVATAIAQILHYWKCPDLTSNIDSYTLTRKINGYTNTITTEDVAVGETYDYANMPNVYKGSETTEQINAVAKLMQHVGYSVKMNYGLAQTGGSGASASAETFTKYWGMDKELVQQLGRSSYNISQWDKILYKEIAAQRPVYYSGASTGGGHAFVIHGYDDGLYYVNWGWGGQSDGYFDITILNPNNTSGAGASSSKDGYSMGNSMIIGIQPDNENVDDVATAVFTAKTLNVSNLNVVDGNVTATASFTVINFNTVENTRYVSVGYMDDEGNICNVATPVSISITEGTESSGWPGDGNCTISFPCKDGNYKLCLIESKDQKAWALCPQLVKDFAPVYVKVQGGSASIYTPSTSLSAVAKLDSESGGYAGMSNTINITVTNTGNMEYYDKVSVYVGTTKPAKATYATGITAPAGESSIFNFAYTPEAAGTYTVWILDKDDNEIGTSNIEFKAATAPVLSFESITCNNVSSEKTYGAYRTYQVEMGKVNDTKAEFAFVIKNDGGYYEGNFSLWKYNFAKGDFYGPYSTYLRIPANTTTTFKFTEEGNIGETVGLILQGPEGVAITELTTKNNHTIQGSSSYFPFGDAEICYLAGLPEATNDLNITYDVADADVARLNTKYESNADITSIDLTKAASVNTDTEIKTGNPNTLIYVNKDANVANTKNVVVKDGSKYTCSNLELVDAMPFKAPIPFKANYAAYSRTVTKAGYYSIYLPFAVNSFSQGTTVEKFDGVDVDKKEVYLSNVTSMDAYTPYIYKASDKYPMFGEYGVEIAVEPDQTGNTFIGTLDGITAPNLDGYYALKPDGSGFGIATSTAYAEPFRAVIRVDGAKGAPIFKAIHGSEGTTGIDEIGSDAVDGDAYYNLKGEKVLNPTKGIYIKNGKKYIFK